MATNLNYNVNVNTTQGIQSLNNLQNKITGLNSSFEGLRNAIAGIAVGSLLINLGRFADGISDLSDATGIAVENILGFQRAVSAFGGSAEGADKAILRLITSIGAAADGSGEIQYAFSRVGVSLEDLRTLSEQDILAKTIEGLGRINNASERSILAQQLLGKEFRNVNTLGQGLSDAYSEATARSQANAEAIKNAAAAYDTFNRAIEVFKLGILSALEPISNFLASLDPTKVEEFAEAIGRIITVAAGIFVYTKAIAVVQGFATAIGIARVGVVAFGLALSAAFAKLALIITIANAATAVLKAVFDIDIVKKFSEFTGGAIDKVKEFFGIETNNDISEQLNKNANAADQTNKATINLGTTIRDVKPAFDQLKQSLSSVADEYARMNRLNIDQINNQTSLIGRSREEAEVSRAKVDLLRKEAEEIAKLEDRRSRLTKEQTDAGLGKVIDEQIARIKEQTRADLELTESAIRNSQRRVREFDLERFARQSQIDVNRDLRRIQDDINKSTMSEMQRREYDILAAARERAEAEIAAEQTRRGAVLTDQERLKFYEAAMKGTDELIARERVLFEQSRQFSTGWRRAFQEYADNATNAALAAQRIFQKATQGMEDVIVNFVKTGKFEFKSLINSMLEELLRSQIRQVMAQVLSISGGTGQATGGGLFGQIGNFLGFANGGIIPTNEPVIVGERGPELLMGAAGRQVIPNERLGANNNVTYNINAVDARSFKELVAADPSFIHAVAMQGGKAAPGRR